MSTNYKQVTSFLLFFSFFILFIFYLFLFFYGNHIIPFVSTKEKKKREKLFNMYIKTTLLYIYVVYNFFKDGERLLCLTLPKEERIALFSRVFFLLFKFDLIFPLIEGKKKTKKFTSFWAKQISAFAFVILVQR